MLTLGKRECDTTLANTAACGQLPASPGKTPAPTERDKQNCAVCHWAAHLMPVAIPDFDELHRLIVLRQLDASREGQFVAALVLLDSLPRGPPAPIHSCIG